MISIIIPYFKKIKELGIVLHNLHNIQVQKPDEIIVVNDGSNVEEIDALHKDYNFLLINMPESDVFKAGQARNTGANTAKGNILIFQDQDMILGKRYIKLIDKYYKKRNQIVTGIFNDIDTQIQRLPLDYMFKYINKKDNWVSDSMDKHAHRVAEIVDWMPHVTESRQFAILKKDFLAIGGFDNDFTGWGLEDTEFFWRAVKQGFHVQRHNLLYSQHLEHPVDPVYLIDSMKYNYEIFVSKHPEVKDRLVSMWRSWNIFGTNKDLENTYKDVVKARKQTGIEDFGIISSMKYIGFWRY